MLKNDTVTKLDYKIRGTQQKQQQKQEKNNEGFTTLNTQRRDLSHLFVNKYPPVFWMKQHFDIVNVP